MTSSLLTRVNFLPRFHIDPHWHPTTADEMKAFVGINIAMGVKDLPEYRDYWSKEPILHDAFVAGVMSRLRKARAVFPLLVA